MKKSEYYHHKLAGCVISLLLHLDVVDLHPTAIRGSQGGRQLDLLGELTPLPAFRLRTLNLKAASHQSITVFVSSESQCRASEEECGELLSPRTGAAGRP